MQAIFRHRGIAIDYTPTADVSAGDVVLESGVIGIANNDIPAGTRGAISVSGVFDVKKKPADVFAFGDTVHWDPITKQAVKTTGGNVVKLGIAMEATPATEQAVLVKLDVHDYVPLKHYPVESRWVSGETNPVIVVPNAATIELGDLLYLNSGTATPAAVMTATDTLVNVQGTFAGKFLGVAMQNSPLNNTDPIWVATSGVFEMDTYSAIYEIGDKVGVVKVGATNVLHNQSVAKVTLSAGTIGRVCKREPVANTTITIAIHSTVMNGAIS